MYIVVYEVFVCELHFYADAMYVMINGSDSTCMHWKYVDKL